MVDEEQEEKSEGEGEGNKSNEIKIICEEVGKGTNKITAVAAKAYKLVDWILKTDGKITKHARVLYLIRHGLYKGLFLDIPHVFKTD